MPSLNGRRQRRRWVVGAVVLTLAAAGCGSSSPKNEAQGTVGGDGGAATTIVKADPRTGFGAPKVDAKTEIPGGGYFDNPYNFAYACAAGDVWLDTTPKNSRSVTRFSSKDGSVVETLDTSALAHSLSAEGIAAEGRYVFEVFSGATAPPGASATTTRPRSTTTEDPFPDSGPPEHVVLARIDAEDGNAMKLIDVTETGRFGSTPRMTTGGGAVWVAVKSTLYRIDAATGEKTELDLGSGKTVGGPTESLEVGEIWYGAGSIWFTTGLSGSYRVPATKDISQSKVERLQLEKAFDFDKFATTGNNAWMAAVDGGPLHQVDGTTGKEVGSIKLTGGRHSWLAAADGMLWIADGTKPTWIDPTTSQIVSASEAVGDEPVLYVGDRSVFSISGKKGSQQLQRIDPVEKKALGSIAALPTAGFCNGSFWFVTPNKELARIPL